MQNWHEENDDDGTRCGEVSSDEESNRYTQRQSSQERGRRRADCTNELFREMKDKESNLKPGEFKARFTDVYLDFHALNNEGFKLPNVIVNPSSEKNRKRVLAYLKILLETLPSKGWEVFCTTTSQRHRTTALGSALQFRDDDVILFLLENGHATHSVNQRVIESYMSRKLSPEQDAYERVTAVQRLIRENQWTPVVKKPVVIHRNNPSFAFRVPTLSTLPASPVLPNHSHHVPPLPPSPFQQGNSYNSTTDGTFSAPPPPPPHTSDEIAYIQNAYEKCSNDLRRALEINNLGLVNIIVGQMSQLMKSIPRKPM